MIDRARRGARRGIRVWLMVLFALVFVMIAVGGLTRLTDSGLSITEWKPVTGAMPPMTQADWERNLPNIRRLTEFQMQNQWMDLADFKVIYWWEWGHRQLGRVIGLVWALGFAILPCAARSRRAGRGGCCCWALLGGAQGAIGWWMVSIGVTQARARMWPATGWPPIWGWPL